MKFTPLSSRLFFYIVLIVILGFNLGSYSKGYWPGDNWVLRSFYWTLRFGLAAMLYYGCYYLICSVNLCRYWVDTKQWVLACLLSTLPFVFIITMIDIASHRPEAYKIVDELRTTGFITHSLLERLPVFLLLNSLFCGLLFFLDRQFQYFHQAKDHTVTEVEPKAIKPLRFVEKLPADTQGKPLRVQAQEHYIEVTTTKGQALIQYKFGEAIDELSASPGCQVHRSYWVANSNVLGWYKDNNSLYLRLQQGKNVPVSRRFEYMVKQHFQKDTSPNKPST